jgi:diguanylate cyclase (GGDEF)-like protein
MPEDRARYLIKVVVLAALLTLISLVALRLQPRGNVSLVYPATGLGAGVLWAFGMRWWPAAVICQFLVSYSRTGSASIAVLVVGIELLVIAIFYLVMTRFRVSRELERVRDLGIFTGGAILAAAVGGVCTALGEWAVETVAPVKILADALSFGLSDAVSLLIFVPLVVAWRHWPFPSVVAFRRWFLLSLLLVTIGIGLAFFGESASPALFLLLPIVIFSAIDSGVPGVAASGTILLVILLGIGGKQHGRATDVIRVIFVGTATATGYILAVVWGEREQSARRLFHLAHHDVLTGMDNRHELETRLAESVAAGPPLAHALLYLDLDQFKLVNDTCGHMAGDRMLQELAGELRQPVPAQASFARLGGDEFACILPHATEANALALAATLHGVADRYRFRFGTRSFTTGVSIGITLFPADERDTADAVLGRADVACYVAKEGGRHRSHVYLPQDQVMLKWHSSIHEVAQIEMAMEEGGLTLYSQSIHDISGGPEPNFQEVLLRLSGNGEVRSIAEFLPIAERFGMMERIDTWVVEHACQYLAEHGDGGLRLSVNVSGSTLNDRAFFDMVVALPKRYGFEPRQLCLEVTEGVMIHRLREAAEAMKDLRARGFDLALDDFGAGVASFAYLQELPVTYVKLDGRIVRNLLTDPASEVIIGSLVRLASLRNIDCIAEWVETEETLQRLRSLGVKYAQGYLLDRPAPLAA